MSRNNSNSFVAKIQPPELDLEYYTELWEILFEELLQANKAAMARLLGISIPTVNRYDPTRGDGPNHRQYWWTAVLENVIMEVCRTMKTSSRKRYRHRAIRVIELLAKNRRGRRLAEQLTSTAEDNDGATRHLLALIAEAPGQIMRVKDINKVANNGSYAPRTLRGAAERLMLIKEKRKDEWTWRIPDVDDCD